MTPYSEPTKEEIGLSSLESPALSIHQPRIQWRPCFSGFRDSANFIPSGMPGYGIRANDKAIVSHHLPVKFLVRKETFKSTATAQRERQRTFIF